MVTIHQKKRNYPTAGLFLSCMIFIIFPMSKIINAQEKKEKSEEIAFVSDTQAPMWIESLLLKDDSNFKATKMVFENILDLQPHALFMMGDVVNLGFKEKRWQTVDAFLKELSRDSIPVYAVLGNHELMSRSGRGEISFQQRFPGHIKTGYTVRINSIAIVLLNSNFSSLTKEEVLKQKNWYESEIKHLDQNDSVRLIIVGCHHSPFTNSKLVRSSVPVQIQFLPAFFSSPKCKLFVSGHAHAFEHFRRSGKDFVTIGGGGGLTHPLNKDNRMEDLCCEYKPAFHYITVRVREDTLHVLSHRLKYDFTGFEDGYNFNVKLDAAFK